jgi:hypothetical protein
MSRKEFEDISIPKWKIAVKSAANRVYRVFKSATEFETVEAENASDAVQKSGISKVYMIKYGAADDAYMLDSTQLAKDEVAAAQPISN